MVADRLELARRACPGADLRLHHLVALELPADLGAEGLAVGDGAEDQLDLSGQIEEALSALERLHEAEEHCKTAIALDYNNAQYFVHLGQVYRAGHLYDKAKKQFEMALRLDPKHAGALKEIREMESASHDKGLLDRFLKK